MPKTKSSNSRYNDLPRPEVILIGGSSGSIPIVIDILKSLPLDFDIPLVIILHRMKNVESNLKIVLSPSGKVHEPDDKETIKKGNIYLAPQNYHLLAEDKRTFSLDYSELHNYSRPSIDVSFISFSAIFANKTMGILLSGANNDGAEGLSTIIKNGGQGIVQDPTTASATEMPESAIRLNNRITIETPENIVHNLLSLHHTH